MARSSGGRACGLWSLMSTTAATLSTMTMALASATEKEWMGERHGTPTPRQALHAGCPSLSLLHTTRRPASRTLEVSRHATACGFSIYPSLMHLRHMGFFLIYSHCMILVLAHCFFLVMLHLSSTSLQCIGFPCVFQRNSIIYRHITVPL